MKNIFSTVLNDLKNYAMDTIEIIIGVFKKNTWNYPIYFEIITLILYCFGVCNKYYLYFLILVNLIIMSYQDIKYRMIYSPYSFMILLFAIFSNPHFTISRVIGILFFPLLFYVITKLSGPFIGDGDVELLAVLGALLGIGNLICMTLITALFTLAYMVYFEKFENIPLVPFIFGGFIQTMILIMCSIYERI